MKTAATEDTPVWMSINNPDFTITEMPRLIPDIYAEEGLLADYSPDEITAGELFWMWVKHVRSRPEYQSGIVDIWWSVRFGDQIENAPFTSNWGNLHAIYDFWTQQGGEPFNWMNCPVVDTRWNSRRKTPYTGFIQEVTGWKPSPLQPSVYLPALIHAAESKAGMPVREYTQRRGYAAQSSQD